MKFPRDLFPILPLLFLVLVSSPCSVAQFTTLRTETSPARGTHDADLHAYFGDALCLADAFAVVCNPFARQCDVWEFDGGSSTWSLDSTVSSPNNDADGRFGQSCSMSSDTLMVGAPYEDVNGASNAGRVYVFKLTGSTWAYDATITQPTPTAGHVFGWSVALDAANGYVAVGAPMTSSGNGVVHILELNGGTGVYDAVAALDGGLGGTGGRLGYAVACSNGYVLAGAPKEGVAGLAVLAYRSGGGTWSSSATLVYPVSEGSARFGSSVAIALQIGTSTVRAFVGTGAYQFGGNGQVRAYTLSSGSATLEHTFTSPTSGSYREYGQAIAVEVSGTRLYVGSPGAPGISTSYGSVYVYDLDETDAWVHSGTIDKDPVTTKASFGERLACGQGHLLVTSSFRYETSDNEEVEFLYSPLGTPPVLITPTVDITISEADSSGVLATFKINGTDLLDNAIQLAPRDTNELGSGYIAINALAHVNGTDEIEFEVELLQSIDFDVRHTDPVVLFEYIVSNTGATSFEYQQINITVTDVNEAPVISGLDATASLVKRVTGTQDVLTGVTADDPDLAQAPFDFTVEIVVTNTGSHANIPVLSSTNVNNTLVESPAGTFTYTTNQPGASLDLSWIVLDDDSTDVVPPGGVTSTTLDFTVTGTGGLSSTAQIVVSTEHKAVTLASSALSFADTDGTVNPLAGITLNSWVDEAASFTANVTIVSQYVGGSQSVHEIGAFVVDSLLTSTSGTNAWYTGSGNEATSRADFVTKLAATQFSIVNNAIKAGHTADIEVTLVLAGPDWESSEVFDIQVISINDDPTISTGTHAGADVVDFADTAASTQLLPSWSTGDVDFEPTQLVTVRAVFTSSVNAATIVIPGFGAQSDRTFNLQNGDDIASYVPLALDGSALPAAITPAEASALLDGITIDPFPNTVETQLPFTFVVRVQDDAGAEPSIERSFTISPVNDPAVVSTPQAQGTERAISDEDAGATLFPSWTVTDEDPGLVYVSFRALFTDPTGENDVVATVFVPGYGSTPDRTYDMRGDGALESYVSIAKDGFNPVGLTPAQATTQLQAITITPVPNVLENPLAVTLTVLLDDQDTTPLPTLSRTLRIDPADDPPVFADGGNGAQLAISDTSGAVSIFPAWTVTDADVGATVDVTIRATITTDATGTPNIATIAIPDLADQTLVSGGALDSPLSIGTGLTPAQATTLLRGITIDPNNNVLDATADTTWNVTVTDNTGNVVWASRDVQVNPVNDLPSITASWTNTRSMHDEEPALDLFPDWAVDDIDANAAVIVSIRATLPSTSGSQSVATITIPGSPTRNIDLAPGGTFASYVAIKVDGASDPVATTVAEATSILRSITIDPLPEIDNKIGTASYVFSWTVQVDDQVGSPVTLSRGMEITPVTFLCPSETPVDVTWPATPEDTTVQRTCLAGTSGTKTRYCDGAGNWQAEVGACVPDCAAVDIWDQTAAGQTDVYNCPSGFSGTRYRQCDSAGVWQEATGECVPDCPADGVWLQTPSRTLRTYTCPADGFSGTRTRYCSSIGYWGAPSGVCIPDCPVDGIWPQTDAGATYLYTCPPDGFSGSKTRTCHDEGSVWLAEVGECIPDCPAEGDWPQTDAGVTRSLTCPPGYSHPTTRRCNATGAWEDPVGECQPDPLVITKALPKDRRIPIGSSTTFSISAYGAPTLAFEWKKDGEVIPGATGSSLSISSATREDDNGVYTVTVTSSALPGDSLSSTVTLVVYCTSPGQYFARGDPHFVSMDGVKFDYQGIGYYKACETPSSLVMHYCGEPWTRPVAAIQRAVGVKVGLDRFSTIYHTSDGTFRQYINDDEVSLARGHTYLFSSLSMSVSRSASGTDAFTINLNSGGSITITRYRSGNMGWHNTNFIPGDNDREGSTGLCGTFDCDSSNDWLKSDGTYASNARDFGNSWHIPYHQDTVFPQTISWRCLNGQDREEVDYDPIDSVDDEPDPALRQAAIDCCQTTLGLDPVTDEDRYNDCTLDVVANNGDCDTEVTNQEGIADPCPGNCNGNGACNQGTCECNQFFTGAACDLPSCNCHANQQCSNGICGECVEGWTGPTCNDTVEADPFAGQTAYEPSGQTTGYGDPSFSTLDDSDYDYRGVGEHVFCRTPVEEMQICQEPHQSGVGASIRAVGIMYGDDRLAVVYDVDTTTWRIFDNGDEVLLARGESKTLKNLNIQISRTFATEELDAIFFWTRSGTAARIELYTTFASVRVKPFAGAASNTDGMCGTWTADKADDFRKRDGTLAADSYEFASDWKLRETDTDIIEDALAGSTSTFSCLGNYTQQQLAAYDDQASAIALPTSNVTAAQDCCENTLGITDTFLLNSCIFDVAVDMLHGAPDCASSDSASQYEYQRAPSGETDCNTPDCSMHGTCIDGFCQCVTGWSGPACDQPECDCEGTDDASPICVQGVCGLECDITANNTELSKAIELDLEKSGLSDDVLTIVIRESQHFFDMEPIFPGTCNGATPFFASSDTAYPDCMTEHRIILDWSDAYAPNEGESVDTNGCGFVRSTEGNYLSFSLDFSVKHTETIPGVRGVEYNRTITEYLPFSIRFPQQTTVLSSNLTVFSPVNTIAAITRQSVNADMDEPKLTVDMILSTQWPFKVDLADLIQTFDQNAFFTPCGQPYIALTTDDAECTDDDTPGNACLQRLEINQCDVSDPKVCSFTGDYVVELQLICQESKANDCPLGADDTAQVLFSLETSPHCSEIVESIDLTATLESYREDTHVTAADDFLDGRTSYWLAPTRSDESEITSTEIINVRVHTVDEAQSWTLYDHTLGSPLTADGIALNFARANGGAANPADAQSFSKPSFQFLIDSDHFGLAADESKDLAVDAIIDVVYTNPIAKRVRYTIFATDKSQSRAVSARFGVAGESVTDGGGDGGDDAAASSSGVIAGFSMMEVGMAGVLLVLVLVLVYVVVRKRPEDAPAKTVQPSQSQVELVKSDSSGTPEEETEEGDGQRV